MLVEYYAYEEEDKALFKALENFNIINAFNPEDGYYILETDDERVITIMSLFNLELWVSNSETNK